MSPTYTLSDFDFALPPELIAQHPTAARSASRLLDATGAAAVDRIFRDLPQVLRAGDLLVVNDTRVIRARLHGTKSSGGGVEALVERVLPRHEVLAHLRARKPPRAGSVLRFDGAFDAEVLGRGGADGTAGAALFRLRFPEEPYALLERHGDVPLPPYITHAGTEEDAQRYQTVFAERPGAVAAPTAALHFDAELLERLQASGIGRASVTLHVGAGTFQPVRTERLEDHTMHREWFDIPAATVAAIERTRACGGRIVAVGTTTLRALESAARAASADGSGPSRNERAHPAADAGTGLRPGQRETDIFITPGFAFRVVDLLITNFHLPKSTLMMLVSAFAGHACVMALYRHAIGSRYRFFSYGDAMLLRREEASA